MNLRCKHIIEMPRLPCLFRMAIAGSATIEPVNSVNSNSVNSFNLAMWGFPWMCFPIELVSGSDWWWRPWWQTICMSPGLPGSSIRQCKYACQHDECWELFQTIVHFEPTYFGAHQISKTMWKVRSLISRIKRHLFFKELITSSNKLFIHFESDMAVELRKLGNQTRETANSLIIVQKNVSS
jgi:hypothetical protein